MCESNPELRRQTTDICIQQLWIPNIFFLKLYFWTPVPLWDDKNVVEWAVTFPTSLPKGFHIPCNHLSRTCLLWIPTIAWEQGVAGCAKGMTGFKGMLSAQGQHRVTCKVHISECVPADSRRNNSRLKITLGFLNDSTGCKRGTWALRGVNK